MSCINIVTDRLIRVSNNLVYKYKTINSKFQRFSDYSMRFCQISLWIFVLNRNYTARSSASFTYLFFSISLPYEFSFFLTWCDSPIDLPSHAPCDLDFTHRALDLLFRIAKIGIINKREVHTFA